VHGSSRQERRGLFPGSPGRRGTSTPANRATWAVLSVEHNHLLHLPGGFQHETPHPQFLVVGRNDNNNPG
jgi:hypothetical protein